MSDLEAARQLLTTMLTEVRRQFDEGAKGWQLSLVMAVKRYGGAIGIERELLDPLQHLMFELAKEPGQHKTTGDAAVWTIAAAAVTVLKHRGEFLSVADAIHGVARLSKLDREQLRIFRNNLSSRKNLRVEIVENYKTMLVTFKDWPTPNVKSAITDLSRFIR